MDSADLNFGKAVTALDYLRRYFAHHSDAESNAAFQMIEKGMVLTSELISGGQLSSNNLSEAHFVEMVQAFDSGSWPASAHVQLYVVSRPVTSGSAPVVHDVEVSPTLETDPVDHLVAIVHASDPDGDALWYSLAAFPDVDKAVFAWFCEQRANKVPLSGRILQQKALDFACMLSHDKFKASPGWLSRFKTRHDIVAKVISGETAAVDLMTTSASCTDPAEPEEGSPIGALDDSTGNSAVPPSLTSAWGELCAVSNEISNGLSVHEFVCADEGVVGHEEVTDEATISSVCEVTDPDEQRPEQPEKTTSLQDVLNAFDTIRTFSGEHDNDVAMDYFLQYWTHASGRTPSGYVSLQGQPLTFGQRRLRDPKMATAPCSVDVFEQLDDAAWVEAYQSAVSEADILRTEVGQLRSELDELKLMILKDPDTAKDDDAPKPPLYSQMKASHDLLCNLLTPLVERIERRPELKTHENSDAESSTSAEESSASMNLKRGSRKQQRQDRSDAPVWSRASLLSGIAARRRGVVTPPGAVDADCSREGCHPQLAVFCTSSALLVRNAVVRSSDGDAWDLRNCLQSGALVNACRN
ncbi:hypothetical protein HPB51_013090 [Rhipicephalus microplus]|uniref:HTH CENPB-type domain-containing protein n=1 Tax=Rhipicephalus microplus TaxID=6941 RepID=A0A9J6F4A3_RHIMP|nr:hypothetical protein HPB51_013090 [Rhipicephalus microplus]